MQIPDYYPYKSEAVRNEYLAYYDSVLAKEWPVVSEERMVATSYGETFVRITGPADAPPLVLLPGASGTSLMWAPNIRALSAACRVYAVDRNGDVGRSTNLKPTKQPDEFVGWMDELFSGLKLDRLNLGGISYGGWMTILYALRYPKRLIKAVPIAPGAGILNPSAKFMARVGVGLVSRNMPSLLRWIFLDLARTDPRLFEAVVERTLKATGAVTRDAFLIPGLFSDEELRSLRVPMLLVLGENEKVYSAEKAARRMNRLAPQVKTEIVAGAGHDLTIVQADTVNRMIVGFLTPDTAVAKAS